MRRSLALAIVLSGFVSGCGVFGRGSCDDPQAYEDVQPTPQLNVPDDLDAPRRSSSFAVPESDERSRRAHRCLEKPPAVVKEPDDA